MDGSAMIMNETLAEEPAAAAADDASAANDILADLTRLRKEVDALRGRYQKAVSGPGQG